MIGVSLLGELALLLALLGVREPAFRAPAFFLKTLTIIDNATHISRRGRWCGTKDKIV